jgi:hypothetical protein
VEQLVERLWQARGIAEAELRERLPAKLFANSVANTHNAKSADSVLDEKKYRKFTQGPLLPGLERKPGQKSLPNPHTQHSSGTPKKPKRDHLGTIL